MQSFEVENLSTSEAAGNTVDNLRSVFRKPKNAIDARSLSLRHSNLPKPKIIVKLSNQIEFINRRQRKKCTSIMADRLKDSR